MDERIAFEQWVAAPIESVFLFFADPCNLPRIMPPELGTELVEMKLKAVPSGGPAANQGTLAGIGSEIFTSFRVLPPLPFRIKWTSLITQFEWNHHFADVQKKGPFKSFHHRHEFAEEVREGIRGTRIRDVIDYDVGFGVFGKLAGKLVIARRFEQTFRHRQRVIGKMFGVG